MEKIEIRRATEADHPVIGDLARLIWRAHYPGIITRDQIEYMLAERYTPERLGAAVASGELTFELLTVDGVPRAFAAHGPTDQPHELKLHQLYVHPEWQRRGLGTRLMTHVERIAADLGRRVIVLTVNRNNATALAAYRRQGYEVRESVRFEIGAGFVMDDHVMEKRLPLPPTAG